MKRCVWARRMENLSVCQSLRAHMLRSGYMTLAPLNTLC
jgi:hypothetical protein